MSNFVSIKVYINGDVEVKDDLIVSPFLAEPSKSGMKYFFNVTSQRIQYNNTGDPVDDYVYYRYYMEICQSCLPEVKRELLNI